MITWPKGSIGTCARITELNVVISGMSTSQNRWWKARTSRYYGILPSRRIRNYRTINQTLWLSRRPAGMPYHRRSMPRWLQNQTERGGKGQQISWSSLWSQNPLEATTTPIVIGALGSYIDRLEKYHKDIHVGLQAHTMQKTVLLDCWGCLLQLA